MSLKQDTSRIEVKPFRMGFIFHSIIHCRAFCGDLGNGPGSGNHCCVYNWTFQ